MFRWKRSCGNLTTPWAWALEAPCHRSQVTHDLPDTSRTSIFNPSQGFRFYPSTTLRNYRFVPVQSTGESRHGWMHSRCGFIRLPGGVQPASVWSLNQHMFKCTLPLLKGKSQKLAIPLARNNIAATAQHSPLCRHLRAPLALLFLYQTRIYPSLEDDWQLFHCFQRLWDQLIIAYVNELHVVNGWWSAESSRIHVRPSKCYAPALYPLTFPITLSVHRHWIGPSASAHPKWS